MTDENSQSGNSPGNSKEPQKVGFFSVMGSVIAAMFGVRGSKYRERDFRHGKAIHFIIGGIIATIIFILIVWFLVQLALQSAKPAKNSKASGSVSISVPLARNNHKRV